MSSSTHAKSWALKENVSLSKRNAHICWEKNVFFSFYPSNSRSKHTMEAISVQQSADERQEKPFMDFQLFLSILPMGFLSALPTCWITLESACTPTATLPAFTSQSIPHIWIPSRKSLSKILKYWHPSQIIISLYCFTPNCMLMVSAHKSELPQLHLRNREEHWISIPLLQIIQTF